MTACLAKPAIIRLAILLMLGLALVGLQRSWLPAPVRSLPDLDRAVQTRLAAQWRRQTGRPPLPDERAALRQQALDEQMLVEEGLRQGLHHRDMVIIRRLRQLVRFLDRGADAERDGLAQALKLDLQRSDPLVRRRLIGLQWQQVAEAIADPREDQLRTLYRQRRSQLSGPVRVDFEQRLFGDAEAARRALAASRSTDWSHAPVGSPFLLGQTFRALSADRLELRFGAAFSEALLALGVSSEWRGPLRSGYGWHLVRVTRIETAPLPGFAEVRNRLRAEWLEQARRQHWQAHIAALRQRYSVVSVDPAPVSAAPASAAASSASEGPG